MTEVPPVSWRPAPVEALQIGIYVAELDRPWIETPFLFQGFKIQSETELGALHQYCRSVYVDVERSDPEALKALWAMGGLGERARPSERDYPDPRPEPKFESPLFENNPIVERDRFASSVQQAATMRHRLRSAAAGALRAVVRERSVDVDTTRKAVAGMSETIRHDPTASLWLTRLKADDDYTSRHAINACVLALTFGHYMGLEGRALENVGLGTLLMDVGRMIVPGNVFPKPGELSETEWAYVRRHVTDGVRLLNRSSVPDDSLEIVRMHHERALGQGYPEGLSGDLIPWNAMIGGLVDTYDALLHDRPYRAAFKPDDAIGLLYHQAPTTFGEHLVESFTRYLGSYPVGTVVELDNGSRGVVVGNQPGEGLWPTVLLVRNEHGEPFRKRALVNLAAASRQPKGATVPARRIRLAVNPREAQIPVGQIVSKEFGLDRLGH